MTWQEYAHAADLPPVWDALAAGNIFLQRLFLSHLEKTNPCRQRYRLLLAGDVPLASYVVYQLKLDIFTFSSFRLKIPVSIIGIPCSLSQQGFAVQADAAALLCADIKEQPGAKLILNCQSALPMPSGQTLPNCRLDLSWADFAAYQDSLRSHYRYLLRKIRQAWQDVQVAYLPPERFDDRMYRLYEEVWANSDFQLEKLSRDFFRQLPLAGTMITASFKKQVVGFALLVDNGDELIFLFTGFDHRKNRALAIYINLLLEIIRYGLERGYKTIDFGQTTEEIKMKLGCRLEEKEMHLAHANPLLDRLANRAIGLLEYHPPQKTYQVFKSSP